MSHGKIVWVLDQRNSLYLDAQPLLSIRNIHLLLLEKNQSGIPDLSMLPLLVKQFGEPALLIVGKDYTDLLLEMMIRFDNIPQIWRENPPPLNTDDMPSLPFTDATSLILCLQNHFIRTSSAKISSLLLDPQGTSITYNGQLIRLTPREFDILNQLYKAADHRVSRKDFFKQVWKGLKVCNKVLDVHVSNLRKKVHRHGINIQFVKPGSFEMSFVMAQPAETPKHGTAPLHTTGIAS